MSTWTEHKPSMGGGEYLKLQNKDKKTVRFVSEPAVITYDGVKLRYQVVLYNKTDKVAQIYEFGAQVFGQIGELAESWGEPTEFDIILSRKGSGQFDTSYTVTPLPKSEDLTVEESNAAKAVKFPGTKSRMLSAYMDDGIMPETIETKNNDKYSTSAEELASLDDLGEPISLDDVPM